MNHGRLLYLNADASKTIYGRNTMAFHWNRTDFL